MDRSFNVNYDFFYFSRSVYIQFGGVCIGFNLSPPLAIASAAHTLNTHILQRFNANLVDFCNIKVAIQQIFFPLDSQTHTHAQTQSVRYPSAAGEKYRKIKYSCLPY